jgi:hypothetical protein
MPDGISTGLTMTDMDCSVGWSISYPTAADAMAMRLTRAEIAEAKLPIEAKQLLDADNAAREIDRLNEVIAIYKL